jgi:carbohydrate-selective porin OprB
MVYERDLEDQNEFGWALSCDQNITGNWGVFLRYGDNDGGINSIKRILSVGLSSLAPFGRKNDQAGVGINYTHPTDDTLRDEYAVDIFYRFQLTEGFELSADTQLIADPSASDNDAVAVFGLRARLLY